MHLSLYPPITYSQASDNIVTVGDVKTMLFIGNPFSFIHWGIFIQRWRSFLQQDCRRCGPHPFPLLRSCRNQFRKYLYGGMMSAAWLRFPRRDNSLSVYIFVETRDDLISCTHAVSFSLGRDTRRERVWMSHHRQVLRSASWTSPTSLQI